VRNTEPGGWYFEFNNEYYPDTDDPAQVFGWRCTKVEIRASVISTRLCPARIAWEFAMRAKTAAWAALTKDNTKMIFQYISFADHKTPWLDPPTVDITGACWRCWPARTRRADKRVGKRPFNYFRRAAAGWKLVRALGRELHLRNISGAAGLDAIGVDHLEPQTPAGRRVDSHGANADGGWGESCGTYDDRIRARGAEHSVADRLGAAGPVAPATTAPTPIAKGVRWLLERQRADGSWDESMGEGATRKVSSPEQASPEFSIWLTLYRQYFPLMGFTNYQRNHGTTKQL